MSRFSAVRYGLFIAFFLCISTGYVTAAGHDSSYIYGEPPTTGNILVKLINNEDSLDIVAVMTNGGDKTPLFALYIPSSSAGSIQKIEKGRYDVYFSTGIDWNGDRNRFNDGRYYKLKSPLIVGDKKEEQIPLYADPGKMGSRIKFIDESMFPDISGAADTSNSDNTQTTSSSEPKPPSPSLSSEHQDQEFDKLYQDNIKQIDASLHQITVWVNDKNWKEADLKSLETSRFLTDYMNQLKALTLSDLYTEKRDAYVFALKQLSLANNGVSEITSLYPVYFDSLNVNYQNDADYEDFENRLKSVTQTMSTAQNELDQFAKKYYPTE